MLLLFAAVTLLAGLYPQVTFSQDERHGVVVQTAGPDITFTSPGTSTNAMTSMEARIPQGWLARPDQQPRFSLQMTSSVTEVERCAYEGEDQRFTLIRQRIGVDVSITDLDTNQLIVEQSFEGTNPPECPATATFRTPIAYLNAEPDVDAFGEWIRVTLAPYMNPPEMRFMLYDAEPFLTARYSPDGQSILAAIGHELRIYDALTGQMLQGFSEHTDAVADAEFSADSTRVVSASIDGIVWVWDATTGVPILQLEHPPTSNFLYFDAEYGPDGRTITTARHEGIRCWNTETGEMLYEKRVGLSRIIYSPDGKQFAGVEGDGPVWVFDAWTGELLFRIRTRESIYGVIYSNTGRQMLVIPTGEVRDTEHGEVIFRLDASISGNMVTYNRGADFSPDDRQILTASFEDGLQLWDAETGRGLPLPEILPTEYSEGVVFSPDGKVIASAETSWYEAQRRTAIRLRDFATGELLLDLGFGDSWVTFSPDGAHVMTLIDSIISVWDVPLLGN